MSLFFEWAALATTFRLYLVVWIWLWNFYHTCSGGLPLPSYILHVNSCLPCRLVDLGGQSLSMYAGHGLCFSCLVNFSFLVKWQKSPLTHSVIDLVWINLGHQNGPNPLSLHLFLQLALKYLGDHLQLVLGRCYLPCWDLCWFPCSELFPSGLLFGCLVESTLSLLTFSTKSRWSIVPEEDFFSICCFLVWLFWW